ncbi:MAG: SUMF1/EgtB/PvdO family nonheme iron enzyme [Gammaproteobacteria bacterium]
MSGSERSHEPLAVQPIEEVAFDPVSATAKSVGTGQLLMMFVGGSLATALLVILWFVFTARSVHINVTPLPDTMSFDSDSLQFQLGERFLVRRGAARVDATLEGYYPLSESVVVDERSNQLFEFTLQKKPGFVTVLFDRDDVLSAAVSVGDYVFDGLRGELAAGQHTLRVDAPRFAPFETLVDVEGGEVEQTLSVSLTPDWANVQFSSMPPNAEILVDGVVAGSTPGVVEILAGAHDVAVRAPGHKVWRRPVRAVANVPQSFDSIILEKADGLLSITSAPSKAAIAVDGRYQGQTPLELRLPPGKSYTLSASRSGFANATRRVTVRADTDVDLRFDLAALFGDVRFDVQPANAQVFIGGERQTLNDGVLSLPARPAKFEIQAQGYVTQEHSLIPNPAYEQTVKVELITREAAREAALQSSLTTGDGQTLVLMRPGPFRMGASRRERGRRANEVMREVPALPEYYVATTEVTNKRFRAFKSEHESGFVYKISLDEPDMPVANVTTLDAVRYCNWLSEKDGLDPAYKIDGDSWIRIVGSGYRLPTEAEWAWAARYAEQVQPPRYAWGDELPPEPDSGNFADTAAIGLTALTLKDYTDGFPATAPVGTFPENNAGLHDIGGNVSEWTGDRYRVGTAASGADGGGVNYVVRGSSWMHSDISELRLTYRDFSDVARPDIGFRIARDLEEPEL